jgi:hypothetical protein
MLATLSLVALLLDPRPPISGSARATCPATPFDLVAATSRVCDALEVTGRIDDSSVSLDPAFDIRAPETELARPAAGTATLAGYNRDGGTVFTFPFTASGSFRLVIPLSRELAASLTRLTLTASGATFERTAASADEPGAEALAVDDAHVIFIWNALHYPAIRISDARNGAPIQSAAGTGTFEQVGVSTTAGKFVVSFSDGVRSTTRTVEVFGR